MRDILEQLLRSAEVLTPERAQLRWDEYRTSVDSLEPEKKKVADAAFATLLACYGAAIYRHIWGFVRSDAAEDVFQDVLKAWHEKRLDPRLANFANVLPWLREVAANRCRDLYRRTSRRRTRETRSARPERQPPPENPDELQEMLRVALSKLDEKQKRVVALHYFEGLDKQCAAKELGIDRGTYAKLLKGALDKLETLLPVLAVGGSLGLPAALSARSPVLSAVRLGELVSGAWARATRQGSHLGKIAAVLVGLAGLGGVTWAAWPKPELEPVPPAASAPTPQPPAAPVETVPQRNERIFRAEVLPKQLAALRPLALGGGEVELEWMNVQDSRVGVIFRLRHRIDGRPGWVSRLNIVHNTALLQNQKAASARFDLNGDNNWKDIQITRGIVLGQNPFTGKEVVVKVSGLEETIVAFDRLPHDTRARAEWREYMDRQERLVAPYLGDWYIRGDQSLPCRLWLTGTPLTDGRALHTERGGEQWASAINQLEFDSVGRVRQGFYPWYCWAGLSAEGQRIECENGEWLSRKPNPEPKK